MDDTDYIEGMSQKIKEAHENVFVFSSHLASIEVLQMLNLFIDPSGIPDVGLQNYHFVPGQMDTEEDKKCHEFCFFPTILGKGDNSDVKVYGYHRKAKEARKKGLISN